MWSTAGNVVWVEMLRMVYCRVGGVSLCGVVGLLRVVYCRLGSMG